MSDFQVASLTHRPQLTLDEKAGQRRDRQASGGNAAGLATDQEATRKPSLVRGLAQGGTGQQRASKHGPPAGDWGCGGCGAGGLGQGREQGRGTHRAVKHRVNEGGQIVRLEITVFPLRRLRTDRARNLTTWRPGTLLPLVDGQHTGGARATTTTTTASANRSGEQWRVGGGSKGKVWGFRARQKIFFPTDHPPTRPHPGSAHLPVCWGGFAGGSAGWVGHMDAAAGGARRRLKKGSDRCPSCVVGCWHTCGGQDATDGFYNMVPRGATVVAVVRVVGCRWGGGSRYTFFWVGIWAVR